MKKHDDHKHLYDEVEKTEKNIGSLGVVQDEGCEELDGIRLIVNDENYFNSDGQVNYDLESVGQAMVLGEVLANPKFKKKR